MGFDRFLLDHDIAKLIARSFWLWVGLGLYGFWLCYRVGAAQLPDPWATLGAVGRGVLTLLLLVIVFPFAAMSSGDEVRVRRGGWPGDDR